ncbi:MAG: acetyl-CoA decarbonylase/synthase complex subunit gamma [Chloroflexi bacterium]|nr:acetyl-CoA decarbonylase/synthase complex subunit gamma [Chloroflexota bacterium]
MAITGLQIYKLLPQTNCKECGFPTCLAFAMKLAAKQAELKACPYVSEASKQQLEAASQPPVRLITLSSDGRKVEAGNEIVLFRHEKTFYHPAGLFVRVKDTEAADVLAAKAKEYDAFKVDYVGINLHLDGIAIENASGDAGKFAAAVETVSAATKMPLILIAKAPAAFEAALAKLSGVVPLLYAADASNFAELAAVAKKFKAPLAIKGDGNLQNLANLAEQVKGAGVEDIVLDPGARDFLGTLTLATQIRRLAIKKNLRALGYPVIAFPGEGVSSPDEEPLLAAQCIAKYAGFIVLDHFTPARAYALLVLRQNLYTDPQKPIQVQPGLYEINNPKPESPVLVTTNFSITYFSISNEVEGAGLPAWLLVADAEGMSVLTAWAAGKFDADRIVKAVKTTNLESKISRKRIVLPGAVATLLGEVEEGLAGWQVEVGPREAVDAPAFLKLKP